MMKGARVTSTRTQQKASQSARTPKPASSAPQHQLLDLQQSIGNHALGHLIQAQLATDQTANSTEPEVNAAESAVNDLRGGEPLPEATRAYFEPRLGHDFGDVRVHNGDRAAESAESIGALAFTTGRNIAFASGQYAPATSEGKRLLAHELTHVVQQAGSSHGNTPAVQRSTPNEPARAATRDEKREFARNAADFLRGQGEFFARQPDRPLEQLLGNLRTSAENGLGVIAGDADAVTIANQLRNTYYFAVQTVLLSRTRARAGSIHTPPTLQELYEQHRNDILPFGLPQASVDAAAGELSAELEATLPPRATRDQRTRHNAIVAARQRLRAVTAQVVMDVNGLFSTAGGTTSIGLPANTTARFSSTVPANLQRGLSNVAGTLARGSLVANTTVMLALDLTPFGGGYDAYRFTRIDLGTPGGEILVERQGAIGLEGLRTEQRQELQERFDRVGFVRAGGFGDEQFDQVLIGLSEIPEAHLRSLGALRFQRVGVHPTNADAAGDYNQTTHTVRLFDRAFSAGIARMGRGGRVLTFAAHAVIHEVGHAHDLSALRTTAAATSAAGRALLAEFGTGGGGFTIPDPRAPERARFNVLNNALGAARRTEGAARSLSGAGWTTTGTATVTDTPPGADPAFRQAALRDGGPAGRQMPTTYPNPDSVWQEYFAESFALFQSSPDLLRRMRPNVFHFMERQFPR